MTKQELTSSITVGSVVISRDGSNTGYGIGVMFDTIGHWNGKIYGNAIYIAKKMIPIDSIVSARMQIPLTGKQRLY
jgi:hypothetical protein